MFGSTVLEVAIGLVFVYCIISLICSGISEIIARIVALRASTLRKGICSLLADDEGKNLCSEIYDHGLILGLTPLRKSLEGSGKEGGPKQDAKAGPAPAKTEAGTDQVKAEKEKNLGPIARIRRSRKEPSWIEPTHFATALLDCVLRTENDDSVEATIENIRESVMKVEPPQIKRALLALVDSADNDIKKVRKAVAQWFDGAMKQVTDLYKRRTQLIIAVIAFVICIFGNVDTLSIGRTLIHDDAVRASAVAAASRLNEAKATLDSVSVACLVELKSQAETAGIPLGWPDQEDGEAIWPSGLGGWAVKFSGLLLTVFAASLGAPFWFGVLDRLLGLRKGKTSETDDDGEKPATRLLVNVAKDNE